LSPEEYNSPNPLPIEAFCEESCLFPEPVSSFSLKIEARHGGITIRSISYTDAPVTGDTEQLRTEQNKSKIWKLNEQNLGWIAGETSVSNLTYEEKKRLFNLAVEAGDVIPEREEVNTQGFEYYRGGIFKLKSDSSARTFRDGDSSLPDHFNWVERHGKNWLTPVKDQGKCGSCVVFSNTGALEAATNFYF